MNKILKTAISTLLIFSGSLPAISQAVTFTDNFDDGVIDPSFWIVSGDGISESGGTLNIVRNNALDSLTSSSSFSGSFSIEFDIMLDQIEWQDPFHGIRLFDASNNIEDVSFGFHKNGQLYTGKTIVPGGTAFDYTGNFLDPDFYSLNTWYNFKLTGIGSNHVSFLVDDMVVFAQSMSHMADFSISIPGFYSDGGSGTSTNSSIDNFSFSSPAILTPLPPGVFLFSSGILMLGVALKRKVKTWV